MHFFSDPARAWRAATLLVLALAGALTGCQSQTSATAPAGTVVRPGDPIPADKVAVQAQPNAAAQAMGGSGMPVTGSGGPASAQSKVLVDAPANSGAQAVGGSGMPAPTR